MLSLAVGGGSLHSFSHLTRLYFQVFTPFVSQRWEVPPLSVVLPKPCLLSVVFCPRLSWQRSGSVVVVMDECRVWTATWLPAELSSAQASNSALQQEDHIVPATPKSHFASQIGLSC